MRYNVGEFSSNIQQRYSWGLVSLRQIHLMKLFVAGLPSDMDNQDFQEMFELYGTIRSAKVILDRESGRSKGYGFVEFAKSTEAMETMQLLNGKRINGQVLSVKPAEERS